MQPVAGSDLRRPALPAGRWFGRGAGRGAGRGVRVALGWPVAIGGALILSAVILLVGEPRLMFADYRIAYYPAGSAVLHGQSLRPLIERGVTGFVNLPILACVLAPLALLPVRVSAGLFLAGGLAAAALAAHLLVRAAGLSGGRARLFAALFVLDGPLLYSVKEGNTSHMVLACLAGALLLLRGGRNRLAGLLLAVAALVKLPLLLFGVYLAARRNWAAAGSFALAVLAAGALSLLLFGPALHALWFDVSVRRFSGHALAAFNVQSPQSALLRLRSPAPSLFSWDLLPLSRAEGLACTGLAAAFGLATAASCLRTMRADRATPRRTGPGAVELEFTLVLCLTFLASPLCWTHYYAWMLIPIALFVGGRFTGGRLYDPGRAGRSWACIAATLLVAQPVIVPIGPVAHAALYQRLGASGYLLGAVLWFCIVAVTAATEGRAAPANEEKPVHG